MIPASWAVVSASPFGRSRSRRAVSGAIVTDAAATARRRESGFSPTSTIRTSPVSSTWESSVTNQTLASGERRDHVEVDQLPREPVPDVVLADVRPDRLRAGSPVVVGELERSVDRVRLADDVERVDDEAPLGELVVRPGVLGEHQDPVAPVDERRLLGD